MGHHCSALRAAAQSEMARPTPRHTRQSEAFSPIGEWGFLMPLTRGSVRGYDSQRMAFEFAMFNDKAETVECQISSVAMDELDGKRGTLPAEREAQFLRLREAIERIASDTFDEGTIVRGAVVRVFAKHIRSASRSSKSRTTPRGGGFTPAVSLLLSVPRRPTRGWKATPK